VCLLVQDQGAFVFELLATALEGAGHRLARLGL
jgi:hypothetical protein